MPDQEGSPLPPGAYITVALLIGLLLWLVWLTTSNPENPPQRPRTNNCEAIAQAENQADSKQRPADQSPAGPAYNEREPNQRNSQTLDDKEKIDRQIAKYNCQLAVYTRDLADFTEWLVIATTGLIIIGVLQGYFLRRSVSVAQLAATEARDAIQAAQDHAETARAANKLTLDIFAAERRAIIAVTLEPNDALTWSEAGARSRVKIIARNHGNSPATILRYDARAIPASHTLPRVDFSKEMDWLLARGAVSQFPHDLSIATVYLDEPWELYQEINIRREDISDTDYIALNILGCIWYESLGGRIYQAAFRWQMSYRQTGSIISGRFPVGQNVPGVNLFVARCIIGNFDREVPAAEIRRYPGD